MKIYTRTGDAGETGLFGGARVRKDDARVEAYGTIDELNAVLGLVRASNLPKPLESIVVRLQEELFTLGAEVACAPGKAEKLRMQLIGETEIERLEREIDEQEAELPELKTFILPSGSPAAAQLHVARTVVRRAERRCLVITGVREQIHRYLNRLSDHLFVLARRASQLQDTPDTPWTPPRVPS